MGNSSIVDQWVADFGNETGTKLALDKNGTALFNYDNRVNIGIETVDESRWVSFSSQLYDVSALSTYKQHFLMVYLLGKNLPQGNLQGAAFALDDDSNTVILCYNFSSANTTTQVFTSTLTQFTRLAASQSEAIENHVDTIPEYASSNQDLADADLTFHEKKMGVDSSGLPTLLDFV
ncbi:MAG: type III secretion system chaperone [Desulfobacterium sp.]|nr:type III secretion system chaperone [Desulfobacterium sp.]